LGDINRRRKPYSKFKAYLAENGISHKHVANMISVTQQTFCNRMNGKGHDFTVEELSIICSKFNISGDKYFIFTSW